MTRATDHNGRRETMRWSVAHMSDSSIWPGNFQNPWGILMIQRYLVSNADLQTYLNNVVALCTLFAIDTL